MDSSMCNLEINAFSNLMQLEIAKKFQGICLLKFNVEIGLSTLSVKYKETIRFNSRCSSHNGVFKLTAHLTKIASLNSLFNSQKMCA